MKRSSFNNISFEAMPKGITRLEQNHGGSKTFLLLIILIILFFGGYWFYTEKYIQPSAPQPLTSIVHFPDLGSIENDLSATVITDYSSLF